jgi:hypothetical protein
MQRVMLVVALVFMAFLVTPGRHAYADGPGDAAEILRKQQELNTAVANRNAAEVRMLELQIRQRVTPGSVSAAEWAEAKAAQTQYRMRVTRLTNEIARLQNPFPRGGSGGGGCASAKTPCTQQNGWHPDKALPAGVRRWLGVAELPKLDCIKLWFPAYLRWGEVCKA